MNERPFYVGYLPHAPASLAAYLRLRVAGVVVIGILIALLITLSERPFAAATFEYGVTANYEGVISEFPYPTLLVRRPGDSGTMPYSRYYLVGQGKAGMADAVAGLHGSTVRVNGTLIYRDEQTMIEVVPDGVEALATGVAALPPDEPLGNVVLKGEIVDSKCYLGVMKPATFKPHKACAIRCLAGGIPAILVVRRPDGRVEHLLLADLDGRALNDRVLDRIAVPVSVTGALHRRGADLVLYADPAQITTL